MAYKIPDLSKSIAKYSVSLIFISVGFWITIFICHIPRIELSCPTALEPALEGADDLSGGSGRASLGDHFHPGVAA